MTGTLPVCLHVCACMCNDIMIYYAARYCGPNARGDNAVILIANILESLTSYVLEDELIFCH